MTITQLRAELAAREAQLGKLQARRGNLAEQLAQVDRDIAALGGGRRRRPKPAAAKARPTGRRRVARNVKPLVEYAKEVLAGAKGRMPVKDVAVAVRKAGYKTYSKDFYCQVAVMLQDKAFRKLGRGVYTLRAAGKAARRMPKAAAEAGE